MRPVVISDFDELKVMGYDVLAPVKIDDYMRYLN